MKDVGKAIYAGAIGTTAMSLYSYTLSLIKRTDFREPKLLAKLFKISTLQGWLVHYAVGLFFSGVYSTIWKKSNISALKSSPVFGLITGLIGIGGWKMTLASHPGRPLTDRHLFYRQLLFAHLVFCIATALAYEKERLNNVLHT
jgi:hypothetical protein